jgi:hypothetical protein
LHKRQKHCVLPAACINATRGRPSIISPARSDARPP